MKLSNKDKAMFWTAVLFSLVIGLLGNLFIGVTFNILGNEDKGLNWTVYILSFGGLLGLITFIGKKLKELSNLK